jgi:hypothetical protein
MDPNANLRRQEFILDVKLGFTGTMSQQQRRGYQQELRELRAALNGWLASGGFEPKWNECPMAAKWFGRNVRATV